MRKRVLENGSGDIMAKDGKEKGDSEERPQGRYRYEDELLSANWNPVIALVEWSCARTAADVNRTKSPELSEEDVDDFLSRIYTSGT